MIPIVLFLVLGSVGMSFSPVGRAFARRLSGGKGDGEESAALAEVDALREDVHALQAQLGEVQERLDFTERLLAQARDKGLLGGGGS